MLAAVKGMVVTGWEMENSRQRLEREESLCWWSGRPVVIEYQQQHLCAVPGGITILLCSC